MSDRGPAGWLSSVPEIEEYVVELITVTPRRRQSVGDVTSLMASIEKHGLLHAIIIDRAGTLVLGWRRLEAFRQLQRPTIPAQRLADTLTEERIWEWELRDARSVQYLTPEERAAVWDAQKQRYVYPKKGTV
jgi:hypothetical protein